MDNGIDTMLTKAVRKQVQAERELGQTYEDYVGKWVAVREHEVVASADSLDALLAIIDSDDVEAVLRVEEETGITCFF